MIIPATTKVAIIGSGHVAATLAYACLIRGTTNTIALWGRNAQKVRAEVLDLRHGLAFVPMASVIGSDDIEIARDADVIVLAVGATPRRGETRLDLAENAFEIVRGILPRLLAIAPGAIVLAVTNPVDVITYAARKLLDLPREQVMGTGTVLDSSRFRALIAEHHDVAVQSVHAYVVGEHGESEVPLWSSATIGSVPVLDWHDAHHPRLTKAAQEGIARAVVDVGIEVLHAKGYTNHAVALATARVIEAVLRDENQVLPVSSSLLDTAGLKDDVALSMPAVINRSGVGRVLPVPLSGDERAGLYRSAGAVRNVIDKLGL